MRIVRRPQNHRNLFALKKWTICTAAAAVMAASSRAFGDVTPLDIVQPVEGLNYLICVDGSNPSSGSNSPFVGEIMMLAGSNAAAPNGWMRCDGSALSVSSYGSLFNNIGAAYGGNGTTTFDLPDLDQRVPIGAGQGAGLTNRNLGDTLGSNSVSLTAANLPVAAGGSGQPFSTMHPSQAVNYIINVSATSDLIGTVTPYAGTVIPAGWALCDGSSTTSAPLISVIGSNFTSGPNTQLPDLRGRVPVGASGGGYFTSPRPLGENDGAETTTIALANLPAPTGSSTPLSILQPTLALNNVIAAEGVYPEGGSPNDPATVGGSADPYLSQIFLYAGSGTVDLEEEHNLLVCDGSLRSITNNAGLFVVVGTTYGGDGEYTFALPDLRGRLGEGADSEYFAEDDGFETLTLNASEIPDVPEPSSVALLTVGTFILARRKRSNS